MSKVVYKRRMGLIGHAFHITMTVMTMGLWGIVYASRLRARKTVAYF